MKKTAFYAFMMAAVVGTSFTACHDGDDDDEEGSSNYTSNFSNPKIDESIIGKASAKIGVYSYVLTSPEYADVYCYSLADKQTIMDNYMDESNQLTDEGVEYVGGSNFYGGFTPTWFEANVTAESDTAGTCWYLAPASGAYKSNNSALLCNPGSICKAFFSRHIAADITSVAALALVGDVKYIYVCPTALYNEMENGNTNGYISDYVTLPAGASIQVVVYGYVDSFNITSWDKTLNSFKNAFSSASGGGTLCTEVATLASADADGKVTVNKEWQKIDLSSIDDNYLFEVYIRVVGSDGKELSSYTLCDDLKTFLVSDITFEGKNSLLSAIGL